jgi:hypothetical protein
MLSTHTTALYDEGISRDQILQVAEGRRGDNALV